MRQVLVSGVLVTATAGLLASAASGSPDKIPRGHYVGQTSQHFALTFEFRRNTFVLPLPGPRPGPALYDFVTTAVFKCNRGGPLRQRVGVPVALTNDAGAITGGPITANAPSTGEAWRDWFDGRLLPTGSAHGTFAETDANVNGDKGRFCSTGTISWTAKLAVK